MKHSELITIITKQTGKEPTQQEIADILGLTRNAVSSRAFRNKEYNFSEVEKISKHYQVNLFNIENNQNIYDNCIALPVLGNVSACYGVETYDKNKNGVFHISGKLMQDLGANPNATDIIFAEGDSMEPTIQSGSALVVDKAKKEVKDGKIYCIRFNGVLMAKRLQMLPPKIIRVISDNFQKYKPFEIDFSKEIDFDFIVVGEIIRWMTNSR